MPRLSRFRRSRRGSGTRPGWRSARLQAGRFSSPRVQAATAKRRTAKASPPPRDIYRVLMTGLNGTPMVSFADALPPEQKWELAAYLLTLRRDFNPSED